MDTIRLENVRGFVDTKDVQLAKLNLFVGNNNSGKSTLLRVLPLLKQSAQVRTVSDLLWFGPYVDFGSHEVTQSNLTHTNEIAITIGFPLVSSVGVHRPFGIRNQNSADASPSAEIKTSVSIRQKPNPEKTALLSEYVIELAEQEILLQLTENLSVTEFSVNDEPFTPFARTSLDFHRAYGIFPRVVSRFQEDKRSTVDQDLVQLLRPLVDGDISDDQIHKACQTIEIGLPNQMLSQVMALELGVDYRRHVRDYWKESDKTFRELVTRVYARELPTLLDLIGDYLTELVSSMQYVSPMRATAERYYRIQDLAVDEIDPQGRNLAMFLKNLSAEDANAFATWTYENMKFDVRIDSSKGHVSIVIADDEKTPRTNLADSGFGYSQVLPILAQLWKGSTERSGVSVPIFFAIEQPELHLHPKMQAQLADLFVRLVAQPCPNSRELRIILETHSETVVTQIGKAISKGSIKSQDVAVYLFDKPGSAIPTEITKSGFDKDGFLTNWPYGFFDAGV